MLPSQSVPFFFLTEYGRDVVVTERLDYFSAIALLGISLIVAIIRTANLRVEAARVMVAAPILAFLATHMLYLQFYTFDYGTNFSRGLSIR